MLYEKCRVFVRIGVDVNRREEDSIDKLTAIANREPNISNHGEHPQIQLPTFANFRATCNIVPYIKGLIVMLGS